MRIYRIVAADSTLVDEGEQQAMIRRYYQRHHGCRTWWGHHYRVMKRRTDPPSLMHTCKQKNCPWVGEQLYSDRTDPFSTPEPSKTDREEV